MQKNLKKLLALVLAAVMTITAIPLSGFEAKAAGVSGYSAGAAVQWARDHWNDYDSVILGAGYWDDGGDCANFVSQCLYMGGLNMNNSWNTSGKWHYSSSSNASFINAHNLYSYLTSIGGQAIHNPSASQISIGDIIFYRTTSDGRMHHSAIVVDIVNGTPVVAAHSTSGTRYYGSSYTLGYSGDRIYLVKMYGSTCSVPNPRSFDVYVVSNCGAAGRRCFTEPSPYAGYNFTFSAGEYCHVDRVVYEYGMYFGHTYGYGANGWYEGWIHLDNYYYQRHVDSASVSHSMGNWNVSSNATCTAQGTKKSVCSKCGHTETQKFGPNGHNWAAATCTSAQYCKTCGTKSGSALGHSWSNWTTTKPSTCTSSGQQKRSCSRCGSSATQTIGVLGHSWSSTWTSCNNGTHKKICSRNSSHVQTANCTYGSWTVTKKATCTETGTKQQACAVCGFKQTAIIDATGHNWDNGVVTKEATCDTKGVKTFTCQNDSSHTYTQEIDVNSHNHNGDTYISDKKDSTCTVDGHTGNTYCSDCDEVIEEGAIIPANGHDYVGTTTNPNCTDKGYTTYTCSVCSNSYIDNYVNATGHNWNDGVITSDSTCCEKGIKTYTCKNDSSHTYTETIDIDSTNHVGGVAVGNKRFPTCIENGYTGDTCCLSCGAVINYGKVVDPLGHDWKSWTQNGDGTHTRTCSRNNNHIETTDCTFGDWYLRNSPSCTETGDQGRDCLYCNYTEIEVLEKIEHLKGFSVTENIVNETCTENGSYDTVYYCKRCDTEISRETVIIDALGHDDEITLSEMRAGETFYFGSYPQSEVADEELLSDLNSYELEWINYGYVYGSGSGDGDIEDGQMINNLDMNYAEIIHNGEKYRAVTFSQYRPAYTGGLPNDEYSVQDENGYYTDTVYWFKYEPLCWRVLNPEKGIVICDSIIDSQPVNDYLLSEEIDGIWYGWGDADKTYAAADYLNSSVNDFLESLYLNVMFSDSEKKYISDTIISNTVYAEDETGEEAYQGVGISNMTSNVHLYLLDANDTYPAFRSEDDIMARGTDYSKSQGLFVVDYCDDYSYWFCRNAINDALTACVSPDFESTSFISVYTYVGIRPVMTLDLSCVVATGRTEAVEPTCTEPGYTEGAVCARCQMHLLESEELPALGHDEYISVEIVEPTCTKDGSTQEIKCSRCEITLQTSEKIDAFGHECNEDWVLTKAPTCLKEGEETAKCVRHDDGVTCDKEYTRPVRVIEHKLEKTEAVLATCLEEGNDEYYTCIQCEKYFADEKAETEIEENSWIITALGHNDGQWICIDEGYEDFIGYSKEDCDTLVPKCGYALHFELHCTRCNNEEVCNEVLDEYEIVATDHNMVQSEYKEPSCVEGGYIVNKCTKCDYTESYLTEATDHNWSDWETVEDAYCVHVGYKESHCLNNCGAVEHNSIDAPYTEHDYVINETVSTECTSGTDLNHYICSRCGENDCDICETADNPHHYWDGNPTDHNIKQNDALSYAPTCTQFGLDVFECINEACEYSYTETVSPFGHDYQESEKIPATCTESGKIHMVCTRNNEHEYMKTDSDAPATGHNWDEWKTVNPATCEEDGLEKRICKNDASHVEENVLTAIGHDWDEGIIDPSSTCKDHGTKTYTCQNDASHKYTEEVPLDENNHVGETYIKDNKDATCTEDGYTGDTYCSDCNVKLSDGEVIPALGHDMGNWYTVTEATCTEKGIEKRECQRDNCDYSEERETAIDPDNHYAETFYTVDKKADCENDGTKSHHCERCDEPLDEVVISKRNHTYDNGVVTTAPTCTEDGIKTYTCTNTETEEYEACTHSYTDVVPATDHDWGEWNTVTPATCEEDGLEKRVCKNDADHVEENVIPAINHNWDEGVIDPSSTCKDHGTKTYTCQNDTSHTYTEEVALDENNHVGETYIKDASDATCTENGYTGDTYCSDCNVKLSDGEVIPATGHNWDEWKTVTPATCEEDGLEKRICKNDASHVEENVLTAIGHDWDEGVIDPLSTCKDHGTKTYTCQNDASHTYTEEVALDENNHVGETYINDEKSADCTNDGYTGDTYCSDCNVKLSDGEVIPATGHDWSEWETVKESTYTEMGAEKRECSKCDAEETKSLPVLTRPSDENENIETEKTVEYDSATGEAVIKLLASSKGEKITVNSRTPLDIVLVLDQSGSMEGDLLKKLKTATENFTNAIYADAVENGIDHRIAMVGFAMQDQYNFGSEYPQYLNTEILTTGGAPIKYNSLSTSKMNEVYKNALVSVNADGNLNPILTLAKNNLEAKGATAADLGLDMACQIFSQNENDGSRKRIVVFMTDGVPTYKSDYMEETATNANNKANLLKNAYEADLYSVGVLSGSGANTAKTFLNNIASKDANGKALYFDSANADKLVEDFKDIATQSTTTVTDFADITLIDTVSNAFTLTAIQENKLRLDAIEKLGITNDDITITRFADGTTEVKLEHINPEAVPNGNDINYVIDFSFSVTANEKALIEGSYSTNTDNAGVIIGTNDVYENNFVVPSTNIENAEGVVYFTVNGITYHVVRVHKGESLDAPEFTLEGEYTFSGWDIPEEVVFDGGKLTVDAILTQTEYTVTWNTADGKIVDTYYAGDIIVVPEIGLNAKGEEFLGWNSEVPAVMPGENLEFTASYGKHEHAYTENVLVKVSCGVTGKVKYTCSCGDSYTQTVEALEHNWSTSATSSDGTKTAISYVYCENCGDSPEKSLSYTVTGTSGRKQVTYDLKLVDANSITVQPDGTIKVSLPIPQNMKNASNVKIYREEADGTKTNLNGTVKNGYITFTTTHFSNYILEATYECDETGIHTDSDNDYICDFCGTEIEKEPEKDEPSGNCSHMCHSNNGLVRFFWKIFNFFNRIFNIKSQRYCNCGTAHW